MAVGQRVAAALDAFGRNDYQQALHDICSAVEVTATKEVGKGGARTYKDFIRDNMVLITRSAFGVQGTWGSMRFKYDHPDLKPDAHGASSLEEILYHVVRCGLYHEAALPSSLTFSTKNGIFCDGGKTLVLPGTLIKGLIVAVMASPVNSAETIGPQYELSIDFVNIVANKIWGKRVAINELLEGIVAVRTAVEKIER